jgi:hypothetical protein
VRRLLVAITTILVLACVGVGVWIWQHWSQEITLAETNAASIALYHPTDADHDGSYKNAKPQLTITTPGTYKVRRGDYAYVAKPKNAEYVEGVGSLQATSKPVSFSVTLAYSKSKLSALLSTEQPAAITALSRRYPTQMTGYTVSGGQLYDTGQWYAATLIPKNPTQDTYRVVLKKEGGVWGVKTTPSIVLSQPVYPDIPFYILSDIDNR